MGYSRPNVSDITPISRSEYLRAWRRDNPERVKAHRQSNRERVKSDPVRAEKERERQRKVKSKVPIEKRREALREFHRLNPLYRSTWNKKAAKNLHNLVLNRVRSRVAGVLCGRRKDRRTMELLGCNPPDFLTHIEKQFLPGMSWDNRHLWHLDHRKPCASFDLTIPEQLSECFHFTNYQPLWALDNIRKGAKTDGL